MEESLEPLSLTLDPKSGLNYCFIKISSANPMNAMNVVKKEMAILEPGQEFTNTFVDENVSNRYQGEKAMSVLFSIAAGGAILLSCSGLLAIVLLVIQQWIKKWSLARFGALGLAAFYSHCLAYDE